MRRVSTLGFLGVLLVLALLVAAVLVGCSTAAAQNSSKAQATPSTPQGILQQAFNNLGKVATGTGDISVNITVAGDQTKMPAAAKAILGQPIRSPAPTPLTGPPRRLRPEFECGRRRAELARDS